jgi:hypothetical protein
MRKFVVLLAVVGASVGVVSTQASSAFIGHEQQCQQDLKTRELWSGMNLRYDGQKMVDGSQYKR